MNILILNWKDIKNPTSGGAELVTYEHAKRWAAGGHSVTWLTSSFKFSKKQEDIDGIKIIRFGNIYSVYLYAPFFYLFSGNKFDLIVDEVHGIPFFTPIYARNVPILVLIHEVAGEIWDHMYSFPISNIGKFLEKIYLKLYKDKFFWTDAEATIDELVSFGIERSNCRSIPCPSNLKPLSKLPVKEKTPTFIWISRIVQMKGIEDVLEAFSLIIKRLPDAKLLIIGNGQEDYVNYLKNDIVKKHNLEKNVQFLGFLSEKEKTEVLKKSHLLLHASVKEGWGIVVIEAASQGTPSIVYNVPGLSESVKDGKTGIVLRSNTPEEMASVAIKLYNDKNKYGIFQKNCIEWANSLSWDKAANQSIKLLENVKND